MAQVAEERTAGAGGEAARIRHWIGGAASPGTSGRSRRSTTRRPAAVRGEVDLASVEEVDRAVAAARPAFPAWRALSLSRRTELFFRIRELLHETATTSPGSSPPSTARSCRTPRARSRAGSRWSSTAAVCPSSSGRLLRAGLDRHRRLLDPPAARRRRRDHAVQLPRDGAHVDVGAGARVRQHLRAEAVREGPVRVGPRRGAARPRPACRTASSTSSTATRSRSTRCSSTRTSRPSRSSARRRSPATSTRPRRRTASAARRSAARRTT